MQIVWLWTDILLWGLMIFSFLSVIAMRQQAQWRSAWQQILYSKQGIVTGLILITFTLIGLIDSIHFRLSISSAPMSLLDYLLSPLGQQYEETYSAPFSTHLYVKKMLADNVGNPVFTYPTLVWVRDVGIANIILSAMGKAFVIWLGFLVSIFLYHCVKFKCWSKAVKSVITNPNKAPPWRALLVTILIILMVLLICQNLSQYYHIMGTDKIGADVFYQGIKSIRTGLIIGSVTSLFMLPVAILGGMTAGYFRGWVDDVIQYIYSTINAIPSVLLIAAAALVLQLYIMQHENWFPTVEQRADARLLMLCMVLGLTNWTTLCRILRGEALKLREAEYILAAKALGVSNLLILWRHILPNVLPLVLVIVVLDFSGFVLIEAVLTYVGVGVDPTSNSWGNMINQARMELAREPIVWWSLATAFILMFTLVLSANLFADKVRDAFDPQRRGEV